MNGHAAAHSGEWAQLFQMLLVTVIGLFSSLHSCISSLCLLLDFMYVLWFTFRPNIFEI